MTKKVISLVDKLPRKKSWLSYLRKKEARILAYLGIVLTIVSSILSYYNPSVVVVTQKTIEYRPSYIIEPRTVTLTMTTKVITTVIRTNGTIGYLPPH